MQAADLVGRLPFSCRVWRENRWGGLVGLGMAERAADNGTG
jgi:hypothetical protein